MQSPPIFDLCVVVDDDQDILVAAEMLLFPHFGEVLCVADPARAVKEIRRRQPDVVLLDANFMKGATSGTEGRYYLDALRRADPAAAIVMMTAHAGVQIAVSAMKQGAVDFVAKPWANDNLVAIVRGAAAVSKDRRGTTPGAPGLAGESPILGNSPLIARVRSLIEKAGPTNANILILGENGTGKELVAREIHRHSRRAAANLLSIDLGSLSENLIESELFGHVKGAFTDAAIDRAGRLTEAAGGTLLLDEIGNLPLRLQPKLLMALEQRQVVPVGANRPVAIDVRVVSATNLTSAAIRDPRQFRQDLLFRLNTVEIHLPALRDRREDIEPLLRYYLDCYQREYEKPARDVPPTLIERLTAHDWPGNVRALRHAAERAVILAESDTYRADDFALDDGQAPQAPTSPASDQRSLDAIEREMVECALEKHAFNITDAARELGLTRGKLYRRMEKHGL